MFKKHMKTQWILTVLIFTKIRLENSHFVFVTRIMLFELSAPLLFYVCGGFNTFFLASSFASIYQPQTVRRAFAENHFVVQKQNISYFPTLVNTSYKTYYRTPVPLLVRFLSYVPSGVARNLWNVFKTKLKKHRFSEVNFQKVLLAPVPLIVVCVDIASFVAMCQKHKKNQYILHAFYVMHGPCGRRNPEFLNRPLDTSVVRFFFGVQRSD